MFFIHCQEEGCTEMIKNFNCSPLWQTEAVMIMIAMMMIMMIMTVVVMMIEFVSLV